MTQDKFTQFKSDYTFYGTHTETDGDGNVYRERDADPRVIVYTMWHPLDDRIIFEDYGENIDSRLYCILYGYNLIQHGDQVDINNTTYEVISIRKYNSHYRIDVKKKV